MEQKSIEQQYPNFKKLTEYLNTKKNPRRILHTVVLLCKPRVNGVDDDG